MTSEASPRRARVRTAACRMSAVRGPHESANKAWKTVRIESAARSGSGPTSGLIPTGFGCRASSSTMSRRRRFGTRARMSSTRSPFGSTRTAPRPSSRSCKMSRPSRVDLPVPLRPSTWVWRRASPSGWAMTRVEPRSAASAACPTGRPSRPWAWVAGMSFGCRGGSPGSAASSEATGQPMRGTRSSTDSQSGQKNGVRTSCTARRPWPRSRSVMPGTSSTWKAAATPLMRVRARAS